MSLQGTRQQEAMPESRHRDGEDSITREVQQKGREGLSGHRSGGGWTRGEADRKGRARAAGTQSLASNLSTQTT